MPELTKRYYGYQCDYPKYDNLDAIECSRIKNIPKDYFGNIGVPLTVMDHLPSPDWQYIGLSSELSGEYDLEKVYQTQVRKAKEGRIQETSLNRYRCMMQKPVVNGDFVFERVIIRRKKGKGKKENGKMKRRI